MWQASFEEKNGKTSKFYQLPPDEKICIYLPQIRPKLDPIDFFYNFGCQHLTYKIFKFLDSTSLLSSSLVNQAWQQFVYQNFYGNFRSRRRVYSKVLNIKTYHDPKNENCLKLELKKTRSKIVDVTVDDEYNILILTLVSGTPHVMGSSLFTKVPYYLG